MPELPEVETIRRDLEETVIGLDIRKVIVRDPLVVREDAEKFVRRLRGRTVEGIERYGKALLIKLDRSWLAAQPMMTGQLIHLRGTYQPWQWTRVVFELSKDNVLLYNDVRKFGRLQIVDDPRDLVYVRSLGPDPLSTDFTADKFRQLLRKRKSPVKNVLLDGKFVAGIGNIYAAEALFRAGIDPRRKADRLSVKEAARLHASIIKVLEEAVRMRGTSMRDYRDGRGEKGKYLDVIRVYGRGGEPCRVCGSKIKRIVQAQRSTFFCEKCQA